MRQLRTGLEWVFLVRGDVSSVSLDGLYRIGWILSYCIVSAGSYPIGWIGSYRIVSYRLDQNTGFYALAGYCLDGTDGLDGALVGRGWGGPTLAPTRTGAPPWAPEKGSPPLDLEGWQDIGSGSWHQLCWCCKDADYLCRRSKIIQIECTQIRPLT